MTEIMTHRGARLVTREQLATIPTPVGTPTHKPIPHLVLVDTIRDMLLARGIHPSHEALAVSANGMQVFGTFDYGPTDSDLGSAMAFRAANDKSLAVQIVAGARVFICDNLALSGSAVVLKRKHSRNLSLTGEVQSALDRYQVQEAAFRTSIVRLKEDGLTDVDAKAAIFDLFWKGILGSSMFEDVSNNYFRAPALGYEDCVPRSVWGLHNACTRAVKALSPASQFSTTMRIGRHFGLGEAIHEDQ